MKSMNKLFLSGLILLLLSSVNAFSAPLAYNNRDIFVGFQATSGIGASTNLIVNLGNVTNLSKVNIDIKSALDTVYGVNWNSRTDLFYGAFGAVSPTISPDINNTLYVSMLEGATPYLRYTPSTQASAVGQLAALSSQYTLNINNNQVLGNAVWMDATIDAGSYKNESAPWASFNPTTSAFGSYGDITGTIDQTLQIVRLVPTASSLRGTVYSGLAVTSAGVVVPEPSTYALLAAGCIMLLVVYRRKTS
jgi:hypothetical protein